MRKIFIIFTVLFWLAVAGFKLADFFVAPLQPEAALTIETPDSKNFSLSEISRHNSNFDCWMAIDSQVYDLSSYLPQHPSAPEIFSAWCGKEASHAWQTKNRGRPHSSYAHQLLKKYLIGKLIESAP